MIVSTRRTAFSLLFTFSVVLTPRFSMADVWPTFRHDAQHTGRSTVDTSANLGNRKWGYSLDHPDPVGNALTTSAIIGGDAIYIGGSNGLHAVNPDGTEKWNFPGVVGSYSAAIGSDGTIYAAFFDGSSCGQGLYAINPDGSEKWCFPGFFEYSSPTLAADGTVYIGHHDGLYAINSDGSQKWDFATSSEVYSTPAIGVDGTIYFGSGDQHVYAVNPDGSEKWAFAGAGAVASSPAIALDGTIYVGVDSSTESFLALNADGSEKWALSFGSESVGFSSPAIASDGTIYIGSSSGDLHAINPDGSQKWSLDITGDYLSSPVIGGDGTIFYAPGPLYAIQPDGTVKWTAQTSGPNFGEPAIGTDGTVYVGSSGHLFAIGNCDAPDVAVDGICPTPFDPDHTPTARFTTSTVVGFVGIPLGFDAFYSTDPQNSIIGYSWDFGDGSPAGSSQAISKIYNAPGTFTVSLTVLDNEGLEDSTERQIVILPADQVGLFNAFISFRTSFNRTKISADRLTLDARVNIGEQSLGSGSLVALEIAGQRFEVVLDDTLRAKVDGPPKQKWRIQFGTTSQAFGEVELRITIRKADLGLGFNQLGAIAGGDGTATLEVPVRLELDSSAFEVPLDSEFDFNSDGTRAKGDGASD